MSLNEDIKEVFITKNQLEMRTNQLAQKITEDYHDKNPIVLCVLKGAVVFMGDLIKKLDFPLEIDFMSISSYGGGTKSSGVVRILKDLDSSITGRDILIVEDILDTGLTLNYLVRTLEERDPKSIKICTLLLKDKDEPDKQIHVNPDYVGFSVRDEFVVGYGLDYDGHYRNLPYIGVLKEEIYKNEEE